LSARDRGNGRSALNWKPMGPGLIADLDGMDYAQV